MGLDNFFDGSPIVDNKTPIGINSLLSVDGTVNMGFQCLYTCFCYFIAHNRSTFLSPIGIVLLVQDYIEQVLVNGSILTGNCEKNAVKFLAGVRLIAAGRKADGQTSSSSEAQQN